MRPRWIAARLNKIHVKAIWAWAETHSGTCHSCVVSKTHRFIGGMEDVTFGAIVRYHGIDLKKRKFDSVIHSDCLVPGGASLPYWADHRLSYIYWRPWGGRFTSKVRYPNSPAQRNLCFVRLAADNIIWRSINFSVLIWHLLSFFYIALHHFESIVVNLQAWKKHVPTSPYLVCMHKNPLDT